MYSFRAEFDPVKLSRLLESKHAPIFERVAGMEQRRTEEQSWANAHGQSASAGQTTRKEA